MVEDDPGNPTEPTLKVVTAAPNLEARMIVGALAAAGIPATLKAPLAWAGNASRRVYVAEHDLQRAREVIAAKPMSEDELTQAEEHGDQL